MSENFRVHTAIIERGTEGTSGSSGGAVLTYSTANRGSLPTSVECRAIFMTPRECLEFGVRGERTGWKFLFLENPQITLADRIRFTFLDGESERTVKIVYGSHARSANAKFWKAIGEQESNES